MSLFGSQEMVWMKTHILDLIREHKQSQAAIVRMEPQVVMHAESIASLTTVTTSLRTDVTTRLNELTTLKTTVQVWKMQREMGLMG